MKVSNIIALVSTVSAAGFWEECTNDSQCTQGTCCDVMQDGQAPTKLCGNGSKVPLGSPSAAYDGGSVRCTVQPETATGASKLLLSGSAFIALAYQLA